MLGLQVSRFDLSCELVEGLAANSLAERFRESSIDDLGETAQLALDRVSLADQHLKDAILWPLLVNKVVAEDLVLRLELSVDAAIPLLHATGVPRHVEVKQVPAMSLEVDALAGRVRGDQDANRVLLGVRVECLLDFLAFLRWCWAVIDRNPLVCSVAVRDRRFELLPQIPFRVVVFGEDDDSRVVPLGARLAEIGAHIPPNPLEQFLDAGVGQVTGLFRDLGHLVEELLFLGE